MGNKIGQIEIPSTAAGKRNYKKQRIKKFRQWVKKMDFTPLFNRFTGYN